MTDIDEKLKVLKDAFDKAEQDTDMEPLAKMKLVSAIGLIRSSKLSSSILADFSIAAVAAYRTAVQLDLICKLAKAATSGADLAYIVGITGIKLTDIDLKNQQQLATLSVLFRDEDAKATTAG